MTQKQCILEHLLSGSPITSQQAIDLYGATRLSGIIYSLKKKGYNILSKNRTVKTRFGTHTVISIYYIPKEEQRNA